MNSFARVTWQWRLAIAKCTLYVFIGMGTIWCATVQSWDPDFVAGLQWYNWSFIAVSMVISAAKDIISFIDKTFQTEGMKIDFDNQVKDEQVKADTKIADIKQDVVDAKEDSKL